MQAPTGWGVNHLHQTCDMPSTPCCNFLAQEPTSLCAGFPTLHSSHDPLACCKRGSQENEGNSSQVTTMAHCAVIDCHLNIDHYSITVHGFNYTLITISLSFCSELIQIKTLKLLIFQESNAFCQCEGEIHVYTKSLHVRTNRIINTN